MLLLKFVVDWLMTVEKVLMLLLIADNSMDGLMSHVVDVARVDFVVVDCVVEQQDVRKVLLMALVIIEAVVSGEFLSGCRGKCDFCCDSNCVLCDCVLAVG